MLCQGQFGLWVLQVWLVATYRSRYWLVGIGFWVLIYGCGLVGFS